MTFQSLLIKNDITFQLIEHVFRNVNKILYWTLAILIFFFNTTVILKRLEMTVSFYRKFIGWLFNHSLSQKCLLCTYYVPRTLLDAGDSALNCRNHHQFRLWGSKQRTFPSSWHHWWIRNSLETVPNCLGQRSCISQSEVPSPGILMSELP